MRDKELTLEVTGRCGIGCPWCSSSATPMGPHRPLGELVDILKEYQGIARVVRLSGGEPTEHPAWKDVASEAHERGYRVVVLTNGLCYDRAFCRVVDEYVIHIVTDNSPLTAECLRRKGFVISLQVVLVKGNERNLHTAWRLMQRDGFSLHLLVLQQQGRGKYCETYPLLTWTGQHGCSKDNKVTVAWDGTVTSCSALKYGACTLKEAP